MEFKSVSQMLDEAKSDTLLDTLDPEEFVAELSNHLLTLACEFSSVRLCITRANIPRFTADLRAGRHQRMIEEASKTEQNLSLLPERLDPDDFDLPRRIETYANFYPSVELKLSSRVAKLLAEDLARGIAARTKSSNEGTSSC
jgi:hypothetical protein